MKTLQYLKDKDINTVYIFQSPLRNDPYFNLLAESYFKFDLSFLVKYYMRTI